MALQIGAGGVNLKTLKKPQIGHFLAANVKLFLIILGSTKKIFKRI